MNTVKIWAILLALFTINSLIYAQYIEPPKDDPEYLWNPPSGSVIELKNIGVISTGKEEIRIEEPFSILGKFGKLYVYDNKIGKVVLFDGTGKYLTSLFNEKEKIPYEEGIGWFTPMDTDITGRIILDYSRHFFLVDGKMKVVAKAEDRIYSSFAALLDNKIYTLNIHGMDFMREGLIKEYGLHGHVLRTFCNDRYWEKYDTAGMVIKIIAYEGKIYFCEYGLDKVLVVSIKDGSMSEIPIEIPGFAKRMEWNKQTRDSWKKRKSDRRRAFALITDFSVQDDEIYLLIPQRENIYFIVVIDLHGVIKRVYSAELIPDFWKLQLGVCKNGEQLSFFFLTATGSYEKPDCKIHMFEP